MHHFRALVSAAQLKKLNKSYYIDFTPDFRALVSAAQLKSRRPAFGLVQRRDISALW